jgi:membrane protease YdiL (CAAX protease family)
MKITGAFESHSLLAKLLIFLGICLLSVSIFTLAGYAVANFAFGFNALSETDILSHLNNPDIVDALKIIQGFSATGLFILPPLIAGWLFSRRPTDYLAVRLFPKSAAIVLLLLIIIAGTPVINYAFYINQKLSLPPFFAGIEQWMKSSEEQNAALTEALLNVSSYAGLLINLFIIALLPAIGEELLFRGILQKFFIAAFNNIHAGIFVTAIFFSAFHMQFYGFLPRFLLGLILGYSVVWSKSLWLPIAGHFINNAAAVIFEFIAKQNNMPFNQDTIGTQPQDYGILAASIGICTGAVILLYKMFNKPPDSELSL